MHRNLLICCYEEQESLENLDNFVDNRIEPLIGFNHKLKRLIDYQVNY
jgi:hypothetical protein